MDNCAGEEINTELTSEETYAGHYWGSKVQNSIKTKAYSGCWGAFYYCSWRSEYFSFVNNKILSLHEGDALLPGERRSQGTVS